MTVFDYRAVNETGQEVNGRIEAKTSKQAQQILGNRGMKEVVIKENRLAMNIVIGSGVKKKELIMFYRQMSNLIDAGVPLSQGLGMFAEQTKNKHFKNILMQVNEDIKIGTPLSKSMEKFPKVFPETTIFQIKAAEEGGFLQKTMKELAVQIRREMEFSKKIKGALVYPIVIVFMTIGVVAFLMLFIIPKISEALTNMEVEMPKLTQIMIDTSEFTKNNFLGISIFMLIAITTYIVCYKKIYRFRFFVDKNMLKVPIIGEYIINLNVARIVRNMGSLMETGVGLELTLKNVMKVIKNERVRLSLEVIKDEMQNRGVMMSKAFEGTQIYPNTLIQVMRIGEETGRLPETFQQLADQYEEEVEEGTTAIVGIINPVLMLIIAFVVGAVVIGMFTPMFSMMDGIEKQ